MCVVGNHRASQCKHRGRERDWKQVADLLIAMFHFGVVYHLSNTISGQVSLNCWTGKVGGWTIEWIMESNNIVP